MDDTPENSVFTVEMWRRPIANEEGGSICIRSCICHRQNAFVCVGHPDVLICKLRPIGALRLNAVVVDDDLTALHHEAWNDSLEDSTLEVHIQS